MRVSAAWSQLLEQLDRRSAFEDHEILTTIQIMTFKSRSHRSGISSGNGKDATVGIDASKLLQRCFCRTHILLNGSIILQYFHIK
jgi:hypothetical protein